MIDNQSSRTVVATTGDHAAALDVEIDGCTGRRFDDVTVRPGDTLVVGGHEAWRFDELPPPGLTAMRVVISPGGPVSAELVAHAGEGVSVRRLCAT